MHFGEKKYLGIVKELEKESKTLLAEDDSKKFMLTLQTKLKL